MEIKNEVNVILEDGNNITFETKNTLSEIKNKYSIGSLFLGSESFVSGVISSMTCHSLNANVKIENDKTNFLDIPKYMGIPNFGTEEFNEYCGKMFGGK
jgi:hypothetical protein